MDVAAMTYPDQLIELIDERADKRIAAFAKSGAQLTGASAGTAVYRTGATTCQVTLDGSALAVPVKVFGDVEVLAGDRVGLVRIGTDWTVIGTYTRRRKITMPDGATTGQQRMVWGADTPPELQAYGLTVAMMGFVLDSGTGLEVGYFFQAVSNEMDVPDSRAMVFGNVTYPTPGNPASATVANVKTNFQMDMWAQFALTIFKDHLVDFWIPAGVKFDGIHGGRAYLGANTVTAGGVATSAGSEVAIPSASYVAEPTYNFLNDRLYRVVLKGLVFNDGAAGSIQSSVIRIRKGAASTSGTVFASFHKFHFGGSSSEDFSLVGYIKNTSGATVASKLSITNQRSVGASNHSLFGDATFRLIMTVQDIGSPSDQAAIAANSASV